MFFVLLDLVEINALFISVMDSVFSSIPFSLFYLLTLRCLHNHVYVWLPSIGTKVSGELLEVKT